MAPKRDIMGEPKAYQMKAPWYVYVKPTYYSTKLFRLERDDYFISAISLGDWHFIHSAKGGGWMANKLRAVQVDEIPEEELSAIVETVKRAQEKFHAGTSNRSAMDTQEGTDLARFDDDGGAGRQGRVRLKA